MRWTRTRPARGTSGSKPHTIRPHSALSIGSLALAFNNVQPPHHRAYFSY
ncbi:hypothetical protein BDZ91DRAFT_743091 [Kalaharituber pfeilii]|nr:hypothetical protein BDZ91DRAFT_743091 [Kalaharituber pfeilii]